MKVLLTGAFGNIGQHTLNFLVELGYEVRVFDIKTKDNIKTSKAYLDVPWIERRLEVRWGDIRNVDDISNAVEGVSAIIHLAAIIPPASEKNPELARAVNVEGTHNLVNAAKNLDPLPKLIFTSSVSVYGPRPNSPPREK